ncbi:MAG: ribosome small subunit-dependent GTPase A [Planctomycetes bacterium]|nr:ribosome small subunit-dependent GTPase A [Planctomycetota bacterium]
MPRKKNNKIRIEFRKKHQSQVRNADLTGEYATNREEIDTVASSRVSGKGDLTRHRTVKGTLNDSDDETLGSVDLEINRSTISGLVLKMHGLESIVKGGDGKIYRCSLRRVLKNLATDQRHVLVAGDQVRLEPAGNDQAWIVRIEPRKSTLSRTSKQRRHMIASNVDQLLIVTSAAQPSLKPNLIDRLLATAEQNNLNACICINKCDLIDPSTIQPLIGTYAQMGYRVMMLSAAKGWGLSALKRITEHRCSVVVGQSGVGKSSILNAIDQGLNQRVQAVSEENQKGKHTTTTAEVFPLSYGGSIIDTPGVRQFQLWDIVPGELSGLFRDIRPFASLCRYPNCSHVHENDCAVKDAVADGRLDPRRYDSYCQIIESPNEVIHDEYEEGE